MRLKSFLSRLFGRKKQNEVQSAKPVQLSVQEAIDRLLANRENVVAVDVSRCLPTVVKESNRKYILGIKAASGEIIDTKLIQLLFASILKNEDTINAYELGCSDGTRLLTSASDCEQIRNLKLDTRLYYAPELNLPKVKSRTVIDIDSWQIFATQVYSVLFREQEIRYYRNALFNVIPRITTSLQYTGFINLYPIGDDALIEFNAKGNRIYAKLFGRELLMTTKRYYLPFKDGNEYKKFKQTYMQMKEKYPYTSAKLIWYFKEIDLENGYIILKPRKLSIKYGFNIRRVPLEKNYTSDKLINVIKNQIAFIKRNYHPTDYAMIYRRLNNMLSHVLPVYQVYKSYGLESIGADVLKRYITRIRNNIENHLKIKHPKNVIALLVSVRDKLAEVEMLMDKAKIESALNEINSLNDYLAKKREI